MKNRQPLLTYSILYSSFFYHLTGLLTKLYDFKCGVIPTRYKYTYILAPITLKMATWVAETCWWSKYNKNYIHKTTIHWSVVAINLIQIINTRNMERIKLYHDIWFLYFLVSEKYEWYILYIIRKELQTELHFENLNIDDRITLIFFCKDIRLSALAQAIVLHTCTSRDGRLE